MQMSDRDFEIPLTRHDIPRDTATYQQFLEVMQQNGDLRLIIHGNEQKIETLQTLLNRVVKRNSVQEASLSHLPRSHAAAVLLMTSVLSLAAFYLIFGLLLFLLPGIVEASDWLLALTSNLQSLFLRLSPKTPSLIVDPYVKVTVAYFASLFTIIHVGFITLFALVMGVAAVRESLNKSLL